MIIVINIQRTKVSARKTNQEREGLTDNPLTQFTKPWIGVYIMKVREIDEGQSNWS